MFGCLGFCLFFYNGAVRHWNRLTREVVDIPSLETFKVRLDRVLSNLIELLIVGGLGFVALEVKLFNDSTLQSSQLPLTVRRIILERSRCLLMWTKSFKLMLF